MTLLPHLLWNTRVGSVRFCSPTFITYRLPLSLPICHSHISRNSHSASPLHSAILLRK